MRDGAFAHYQGKEHEIHDLGQDQFWVISQDPADIARGFQPDGSGDLIKQVSRAELINPRLVETWASYHGNECQVTEERDGQLLLLYGINADIARELDFTEVERGVWEKWVGSEDVERTWFVEHPL